MKTKLLKIVRKRYTIDKVSSYSNVANSTWKEYCDRIGMPFYYVVDTYDGYGIKSSGFSSLSVAIEYVRRLIRISYTQKRKRVTKAKIEKVWYK